MKKRWLALVIFCLLLSGYRMYDGERVEREITKINDMLGVFDAHHIYLKRWNVYAKEQVLIAFLCKNRNIHIFLLHHHMKRPADIAHD